MFRDIVEADRPEQRVVAWRFAPPEPDRLLTPLREAMASGLLTIRFGAIVKRVKTDAAGRATGVDYIDRQTRQVGTANAANVVLCASPIETVRLLLNSKSAEHGHGLGNSSGTLGRFFMDQLPNLAAGRFHPAKGWELDESQPKDDFYAPTGGIFLPRPETSIRERGEFAFQGSVGRAPVDSQNDPARFSFFGFGQMLPHEDNRITLDSRRTDSWRLPAAHIRCVMHDYEKQLLKRQEQTLQDMVERAGGEFEFIGSPLGLREMGRGGFPDADPFSRFIFRNMFHKSMCMGSAIHETGGAVMGADSRTSVLNTWGQSWDVPNLFVTDASAFPGSGVSGTTLTVMAQTVRACRRLAEEYRAGRL
jgi:choline dehydrogenase-like flavoprotein